MWADRWGVAFAIDNVRFRADFKIVHHDVTQNTDVDAAAPMNPRFQVRERVLRRPSSLSLFYTRKIIKRMGRSIE